MGKCSNPNPTLISPPWHSLSCKTIVWDPLSLGIWPYGKPLDFTSDLQLIQAFSPAMGWPQEYGERRDVLLVEERYPGVAWTLSKTSVQVWTAWNFEFPRLSRDFLFFMSDSSYQDHPEDV